MLFTSLLYGAIGVCGVYWVVNQYILVKRRTCKVCKRSFYSPMQKVRIQCTHCKTEYIVDRNGDMVGHE